MPGRRFPFSPRRATELDLGDVWAVALPNGRFGAAQVVDLRRSGVGSAKALVAGILDWRGDALPSAQELSGRRVVLVGLTRMEVFTETGAEVLGNVRVHRSARSFDSPFGDHHVGARHRVLGWQAFIARVAEVAGSE